MDQTLIDVYAMRVDDDKVYRGYVERIPNTLKSVQEFVGGTICVVSLNRDILLVLNDNGKLIDLPVNRVWEDKDRNVLDILMGNVFACRSDGAGEFASILEEDIPVILQSIKPIYDIRGYAIMAVGEEGLPIYVKNDSV